jgi:hypothetical protein
LHLLTATLAAARNAPYRLSAKRWQRSRRKATRKARNNLRARAAAFLPRDFRRSRARGRAGQLRAGSRAKRAANRRDSRSRLARESTRKAKRASAARKRLLYAAHDLLCIRLGLRQADSVGKLRRAVLHACEVLPRGSARAVDDWISQQADKAAATFQYVTAKDSGSAAKLRQRAGRFGLRGFRNGRSLSPLCADSGSKGASVVSIARRVSFN